MIEKVRVLVADDNEYNQTLIKRLLLKLGITCDIVGNGQEVLDKLDSQDYDLLLLDMHMPVLNGTDTIKSIRNSTKYNRSSIR